MRRLCAEKRLSIKGGTMKTIKTIESVDLALVNGGMSLNDTLIQVGSGNLISNVINSWVYQSGARQVVKSVSGSVIFQQGTGNSVSNLMNSKVVQSGTGNTIS